MVREDAATTHVGKRSKKPRKETKQRLGESPGSSRGVNLEEVRWCWEA